MRQDAVHDFECDDWWALPTSRCAAPARRAVGSADSRSPTRRVCAPDSCGTVARHTFRKATPGRHGVLSGRPGVLRSCLTVAHQLSTRCPARRDLANLWPNLANSGQIYPNLTRCLPNLGKIRPTPGNTRPRSPQWVPGQSWPIDAWKSYYSAKLEQQWPRLGQNLANFGRVQPNATNAGHIAPIRAEFG